MSIHYHYYGIFILVCYRFCTHTISMFCSAPDAVCSGNKFIVFNVEMLKVAMLTMLLHLFSLCSVSDFRAPTSVELAEGWCGLDVWFELVTITFWWRSFFFLLINRRHPYRWVAVVSWLNYLILVVDQWDSFTAGLFLDSFTLLHNHYATSLVFLHICVVRIILSSLRGCYQETRLAEYLSDYGESMFKYCRVEPFRFVWGFKVAELFISGIMLAKFWCVVSFSKKKKKKKEKRRKKKRKKEDSPFFFLKF